MTAFSGFPTDALAFFEELEANNDRTWWLANKARFEATVSGPMRALLDVLDPDLGPFRVFRMNRDVRFAKDKSPYKTAHAAMTEAEGGTSLYLQLNKEGLWVGGGIYHPTRDQLARFRDAVADDASGPAFAAAVAAVRKAGAAVTHGEGALSTTPKGFAKDHPRIDLLRWKGCVAMREVGAPAWLSTPRVVKEVRSTWTKAAPVLAWLDTHVGPSQEPPPD